MPVIKLKHVVSFSSEDKRFPAENLLKPEGTVKWKSAGVGEKSVSAILQLEKATLIHQIDIGNEGAAFVEVLVGRSSQKEEDYKVLLVASSFMNPMESRNGTNPTRVRIFPEDKLSKAAVGEKWDRIRVVCTQPFNKTIQYGLSFIKFHSPPREGEEPPPVQKQATLGVFKLKSEAEETGITAGSLFAQKKEQNMESPSLTGAAAVRAASRIAEAQTKAVPSPSPRPSMSQAQTSRPRATQDESPSVGLKRKHSSESKESRLSTPMRKQSSDSSVTSSSSKKGEPPFKKTKSESSSSGSQKPIARLMEKVVFVLSGFQNPRRGQIRDRALEMGAQYKADWDRTCTHLICAFTNTPKYQQVAGKARIVTKDWVKECYQNKRLLPWRKYRLGDAESPPASSDESSDEDTPRKIASKPAPKKQATPSRPPKALKDYDDSTDGGSAGDTDDEIERARAQQAFKTASPAPPPRPAAAAADPYGASTDEEDNAEANDTMNKNGVQNKSDEEDELPPLPDFFKHKGFFLYGMFAAADRRRLLRYITAYNGSLEEYMDDRVNFVLTNSDWDDNFDTALSDNPSLMFVKPDWVYTCHDQQKLQPFQKYVVLPQS